MCETTFPVGKQKLNDAFSGITYINYNRLHGFADKISYERMVKTHVFAAKPYKAKSVAIHGLEDFM